MRDLATNPAQAKPHLYSQLTLRLFRSLALLALWGILGSAEVFAAAPGAPTISSSPTSALLNQTVSITVTRGTDPDGHQVKVHCTATASNRTNASPYISTFSTGGTNTTATFIFSSAGTQTIYCTSFDSTGAGSSTRSRTISVTANRPPTAPAISSSPSTALLNQTVSITVTRGTDPDGNQVKVQCTGTNSNRTNASPYASSLGTGGTQVTATFVFSVAGTQTIYCTSFDSNGAASSTSSRTITVNRPPTAPSISSSPSSAMMGQTVSVVVTRGTDPDGNQVKVQCTASGSDRTNASPYISTFSTGGTTTTATFVFSTSGTQTIYCASFDTNGAGSSTSSRTISITANRPPTTPTIGSSPSSALLNQTVSVLVTRGTDPDGNQVKVECTATGSNRTNASPYASSLGTGGTQVTATFVFSVAGTQTIYCTSFDSAGAGSSTASRTISITSNRPPTAPTISSSPTSAILNQTTSVVVTRGTDPDGNQVKVECTATGSDRTSASPYASTLATGGTTTTATFTFTVAGTQTIYCTSFDSSGASSPVASRTISVIANRPPTAPTISGSPSTAPLNQTISVSVTRGTDPDGHQVKIQCTATGSNRTDSSPYASALGTGGTAVTATFVFTVGGTQTIYCASYDSLGAGSSTAQRSITIQVPDIRIDQATLTFGRPSTPAIRNPNVRSRQLEALPVEERYPKLEQLLAKAESQGTIQVIVGITTRYPSTDDRISIDDLDLLRRHIADRQQAVLQDLKSQNVTLIKTFDFIPALVLRVDRAALEKVSSMQGVTTIGEDIGDPPALASSNQVIGTAQAWAAGLTGAGQVIAIFDSGVEKNHRFFANPQGNRIISEACFSTTDNNTITSLCPGGAAASTALDSGIPCDWRIIGGCDHGTHVAGIAAGNDDIELNSGVARGADIISIQVFSRIDDENECEEPYTSCVTAIRGDRISALEHIFTLATTGIDIAAINMSINGAVHTSECRAESQALTTAIENLRDLGIATINSSGNDDSRSGIGFPACIEAAVSVAATEDDDTVATFSNVAPFLDLLAPGSNIDSAIPGDPDIGNKNGTSMAAPHVAGAWAIIKQANPWLTVEEVLTLLRDTGVSVDDNRPGGTVRDMRRIDIEGALASLEGGITKSFSIYNDGAADLQITSIQTEQPSASVTWLPTAPVTIPPGGSWDVEVTVNFDNAPAGTSTVRLLINSNDPDENPFPNGVLVTINKIQQ